MFNNRSSAWTVVLVAVCVVVVVCAGVGDAAPPPICLNQKLPLSHYARKLCAALTDISEFSRAMEEYLDAQGNYE